ncbi:MAG: hypothetical protein A2046_14640 [Bacteroidetes bacterium GWA2_30_7]|nr:MAG: hypothetical protein A2046_14640 [Bacteroidetes bacterium GWA2_30_7]
MKEVTLYIQENKFKFFMDIVRNFDFVKVGDVDNGDTKETILANIKTGLDEIKQIEKGKLKARPAKDFLNEL